MTIFFLLYDVNKKNLLKDLTLSTLLLNSLLLQCHIDLTIVIHVTYY